MGTILTFFPVNVSEWVSSVQLQEPELNSVCQERRFEFRVLDVSFREDVWSHRHQHVKALLKVRNVPQILFLTLYSRWPKSGYFSCCHSQVCVLLPKLSKMLRFEFLMWRRQFRNLRAVWESRINLLFQAIKILSGWSKSSAAPFKEHNLQET